MIEEKYKKLLGEIDTLANKVKDDSSVAFVCFISVPATEESDKNCVVCISAKPRHTASAINEILQATHHKKDILTSIILHDAFEQAEKGFSSNIGDTINQEPI